MKKPAPWRQLALWLPALAWYAVIFYFSAQTGAQSTETSDAFLEHAFHWDIQNSLVVLSDLLSVLVRKAAHMFVFFVQTALILLPLQASIHRPRLRYGVALALCAGLAALDELHQYFVPGRSCKLSDVLIDLAGGLCLLLFLYLLRLLRRRKKTPLL